MSHHAPTSITDAAHGPATGDYECFCREVRRLYGIDLTQYRRGPMERRVRVLAARRGRHLDLVAYADLLAYDQAELTTFLSRVTVNVSRLWRNPGQWHLLEHDVIPGLAAAGDGRLRCWSAGSSYGAEAYTLAAVANRAVPHVRTTILGTDIDADMIARARAGVFSADDVRDAPVAALANYFTKAGGWWHVNDELRRRVRFEQGDLLRQPVEAERFDLVLCRNTVIYFTDEARDALHARLAHSIRRGGVLVIGSRERIARPRAIGLQLEAPHVFRKR